MFCSFFFTSSMATAKVMGCTEASRAFKNIFPAFTTRPATICAGMEPVVRISLSEDFVPPAVRVLMSA